ncbi:HAMP domain-containing sensor histidine kinase [Oceanospirillum sp. HFRX-1_2]
MAEASVKLGIRAKLVALFLLIKVIPLVLLALLAWQGVVYLGERLNDETRQLSEEVRHTVKDMGDTFSEGAERALNDRAREELERLTTDTARNVAKFLYQRDEDLKLAAALPMSEESLRGFILNRKGRITETGDWRLAKDGSQWLPVNPLQSASVDVQSSNDENKQDFHYRPPEVVQPSHLIPLYHEISFIGLDGHERIKVQTSDLLPKALKDVSRPENTYAKAEHYFAELKKLKPGEIYVSDVIGPYVPSRILGPATPKAAEKRNIPFQPEQEAYAGRENPVGQKFRGIIRWATPVERNGKKIGYVTLALNHDHILSFTDNLKPTNQRYDVIADASSGNYAFMWDYKDRNIAHPRHHSIVGFDPETGERAVPWLEVSLYQGWQQSGQSLQEYLSTIEDFDQQTRSKKPAAELIRQGQLGLDCRYLNFAPQCKGWNDLTHRGGSGSFLIYWTGVWKLTTAATIPYFTGHYGDSPRGFGFVTIGANIDDFQLPAKETAARMDAKLEEFTGILGQRQTELSQLINEIMADVAMELTISTVIMIIVVVIIAVWMASMLTGLVRYFTSGLQKMEQGDYSYRFEARRKDELGQLSHALNRMADSVEASFTVSDKARRDAEKASQMKSDFLARMSHELRTPLNGIMGFAEILQLDEKDEETREYADIIHQSGKHLLRLVDDILDLAKMDAGQLMLTPHEIKLESWLKSFVISHRGCASKKGVQLLLNTSGLTSDSALYVDDTRLRQVLNNLVENAIKFTRQGNVELVVSESDNEVMFDVLDQGEGIPEQAHERVFEAFRQATEFVNRSHGGTGLGLSIVRELCHVMGGRVQLISSVEGEGSHFRVTLPKLRDPEAMADD